MIVTCPQRAWTALLTSAILGVVAGGCADTGPADSGVIVRDSAGITIVENAYGGGRTSSMSSVS